MTPPSEGVEHAHPPATVDLEVHLDGPSALVTVAGEIDLATSALLQAVFDDVLRSRREPPVARLVLDMRGVAFVDASGLSPVLHARAVLARRGGALEVRRPSFAVRRLLRVLGMEEQLVADHAAAQGAH